jgi:hypothetical protein
LACGVQIKGTTSEHFDVHPNQIQDWKKQLVTKAENVFGAGMGEAATQEQV